MGLFSFPKTARLRNPAEFKKTLDNGNKAVNRHMIVFAFPRAEEPKSGPVKPMRMGLIVSRKVGNSVERNRVKRALREGFRHLQADPEVAAKAGKLDIVVIARPSTVQASSAEIVGSLRHGLGRLNR